MELGLPLSLILFTATTFSVPLIRSFETLPHFLQVYTEATQLPLSHTLYYFVGFHFVHLHRMLTRWGWKKTNVWRNRAFVYLKRTLPETARIHCSNVLRE